MKFFFPLFVALAMLLASGADTTDRPLQEDVDEFWSLVDLDSMVAITLDYLINDPEMQELAEYLQHSNSTTILKSVVALPEYSQLIDYMYDVGLDISVILDIIYKLTHCCASLPCLTPHKASRIIGGVKGFWEELIALVPAESIQELYRDKMANSPRFKQFVERLHGQELQVITSTVEAMEEYQELVSGLRARGVDLDKMKSYIHWLFTGDNVTH